MAGKALLRVHDQQLYSLLSGEPIKPAENESGVVNPTGTYRFYIVSDIENFTSTIVDLKFSEKSAYDVNLTNIFSNKQIALTLKKFLKLNVKISTTSNKFIQVYNVVTRGESSDFSGLTDATTTIKSSLNNFISDLKSDKDFYQLMFTKNYLFLVTCTNPKFNNTCCTVEYLGLETGGHAYQVRTKYLDGSKIKLIFSELLVPDVDSKTTQGNIWCFITAPNIAIQQELAAIESLKTEQQLTNNNLSNINSKLKLMADNLSADNFVKYFTGKYMLKINSTKSEYDNTLAYVTYQGMPVTNHRYLISRQYPEDKAAWFEFTVPITIGPAYKTPAGTSFTFSDMVTNVTQNAPAPEPSPDFESLLSKLALKSKVITLEDYNYMFSGNCLFKCLSDNPDFNNNIVSVTFDKIDTDGLYRYYVNDVFNDQPKLLVFFKTRIIPNFINTTGVGANWEFINIGSVPPVATTIDDISSKVNIVSDSIDKAVSTLYTPIKDSQLSLASIKTNISTMKQYFYDDIHSNKEGETVLDMVRLIAKNTDTFKMNQKFNDVVDYLEQVPVAIKVVGNPTKFWITPLDPVISKISEADQFEGQATSIIKSKLQQLAELKI